ncbi:DUF2939 domain-containing protein [Acinetobacter sp. NIPH 2699]|uniref:DUF2939 domain-containing protein n=1 Tax=Acinetobacter sp. NIPH 2699 TaxID=2923433 RepID=UPI001F4A773F|nr:DUF2939 domain-containing protein [Acinetobacter sp. NIPH 2699]MCH7335743.1 DUF2939 domain-containing protein [Acinetobacter sp. NIPH 2699]
MSKKLKTSIVVVLLLVVGYLFAAPYLTIYQIHQAVKNDDSTALAGHIDFPSVRQSLKDQVNAQMLKDIPQVSSSDRGLAALGAVLASSMVDKLVDVMVTPQGVSMLLQGKKLKESLPWQDKVEFQPVQPSEFELSSGTEKASDKKANYKARYQSFHQFAVEIQQPEQQMPVNIILQRQGLSWKVTQILLPTEQLK